MSNTAVERVAYELRDSYTGTVEIERDGEKVEVPRYGGGVLAYGSEGGIDVGAALGSAEEYGPAGFLVLEGEAAKDGKPATAPDQGLVNLLDAYPPLKRTQLPEPAKPAPRKPAAAGSNG